MLLSRPSHRVRVAILDDHPVTTMGIASFLRGNADLDVVHADTSAETLVANLRHAPCDVAVVDYYLPNDPWDGMDFIRRLRRLHPAMAVITLSAGRVQDTEYAAYRAGANGYLSKTEPPHTIPDMIRATIGDPRNFYVSSYGRVHRAEPQHPDARLTAAETEILRHISLGLSVTQVATRLVRSKKTVSTHKRRAMRKLGLADDLALALYLKEKFRRNIIE
ncbi:response regulator transcription factor [Bordetella genomosp. 13]|uniref:response regulator transcription factor n=1 Tax=Bordetella genomosp. 13 TaxID=463040 RepID=UPI0016423F01